MSRGMTFKAVKCPNDELALTNKLIVHPNDFKVLSLQNAKLNMVTSYVILKGYVFSLLSHSDPAILPGTVGFSGVQRRYTSIALGDTITLTPLVLDESYLGSVSVEVDYALKSVTSEEYQAVELSNRIATLLDTFCLTVGQQLVVDGGQGRPLQISITGLDVINLSDVHGKSKTPSSRGFVTKRTEFNFTVAPKSNLKIRGTKKSSPFRPDFDFANMGIGGLDEEFNNIFRRAFASRVFPAHIVAKLGIKHIKGILLYGPPGTGKTLMARQIGKMLNGKEPKVVNGPEILSKYVGQSEENIRSLFKEAEDEYKAKGDDSDLHIIIFDEIDAICKARGTTGGSTGVGDTVVNQLLSKIDGVDSLNNILVIGMTNRKDMIDEALLRPGRLEVQMEISLPDQAGRLQILKIHTSKMSTNGYLDPEVDLEEFSQKTKNYTGAEIEGLVKSAASFAFNRHINATKLLSPEDPEHIKITKADFINAFSEVTPAFGVTGTEFKEYLRNGIVEYGSNFLKLQTTLDNFIQQVRNSDRTPLVSVLLRGSVGCGKTALAASLAIKSDFPFAKIITPEELVNYSEAGKCTKITKVFQDAYKSPLSVIVLDDIERLLDYVPIGPRFSNAVLQTLLVLIKKVPSDKKKLLIIGTTSSAKVLEDMELMDTFNAVLDIPNVKTGDEVRKVLESAQVFQPHQLDQVSQTIYGDIPVKKLLLIAEMARQADEGDARVERFIQCMEDYGVRKY